MSRRTSPSRSRWKAHDSLPRDLGTCSPCGKRSFPTRAEAKRAARLAHPGDHLDEYRCPEQYSERWHYGHLQRAVVHGAIKRRN